MATALEAIGAAASDRRSGSASVARAAAGGFEALADELRGAGPEEIRSRALDACRVLLEGQPVMAPCIRLADAIVRAVGSAADPADLRDTARSYGARLAAEHDGLVGAIRTYLPRTGTVVTVSASSAMRDVLAAAPRRLHVLCAASEPGGQGRALATDLRASGVNADVLPDAAVASAAAAADLVAVGADAVGPSHFLSETGTLAAFLGAREGGRLRLVLTGTTTFVDAETWKPIEDAASRRAAGETPMAVAPSEPTPLRLCTAVLTEDGPLSPAPARRLARASKVHADVLTILTSPG